MFKFNVRVLKDPLNLNRLPAGKEFYGIYHGSCFWELRGYSNKKWMTVFNIDMDHKKYLEQGHSLIEMAEFCLNELNKVPERKKFSKRMRKPPFGLLDLYRVYAKSDKDGDYIQVMATTDKRKSKFLFTFGDEVETMGSGKRPGSLRRKAG
tara:strand:+ start:1176 stop:1628 length:453 start_codon:yes stop_codon:yes gene_type:complete